MIKVEKIYDVLCQYRFECNTKAQYIYKRENDPDYEDESTLMCSSCLKEFLEKTL